MTTKQPETYAEFEASFLAAMEEFLKAHPEQARARTHHVAVCRASAGFSYALQQFLLSKGSCSVGDFQELAISSTKNIVRNLHSNATPNTRMVVMGNFLEGVTVEVMALISSGQGTQLFTANAIELSVDGSGRA